MPEKPSCAATGNAELSGIPVSAGDEDGIEGEALIVGAVVGFIGLSSETAAGVSGT